MRRIFLMVVLGTGVVAGYSNAIHSAFGGGWHGSWAKHCSHTEATVTP